MKNSNETIGKRTRDLPTCSAVPHVCRVPYTNCIHNRLPEEENL